MSDDEETIEIRRQLRGEWWYFAGQLRMALDHKHDDPDLQWTSQPTSSGCIIYIGRWPMMVQTPIASVMFISKDSGTTMIVHTRSSDLLRMRPFIDDLEAMAREARDARRGSIGETFREILDDYYERKARGESPNLREMARTAGVNIGSLRQAKIRYDTKRREQDISRH